MGSRDCGYGGFAVRDWGGYLLDFWGGLVGMGWGRCGIVYIKALEVMTLWIVGWRNAWRVGQPYGAGWAGWYALAEGFLSHRVLYLLSMMSFFLLLPYVQLIAVDLTLRKIISDAYWEHRMP